MKGRKEGIEEVIERGRKERGEEGRKEGKERKGKKKGGKEERQGTFGCFRVQYFFPAWRRGNLRRIRCPPARPSPSRPKNECSKKYQYSKNEFSKKYQ